MLYRLIRYKGFDSHVYIYTNSLFDAKRHATILFNSTPNDVMSHGCIIYESEMNFIVPTEKVIFELHYEKR